MTSQDRVYIKHQLYNGYNGMLLGAVGALLFLTGCGGQATADGPTSERTSTGTRVETYVVEPADFTDVLQLTGHVQAVHDATLSAQASGTVVALEERGAFVREGAPVARLDPTQGRASVDQARAGVAAAEAQYALAQDTYDRMQPLYQDSIISAQEFERVRSQLAQAQANLAQARATLAQAEKRLTDTYVIAPFAGTVETRFVEEGEQISPGQPVARIVNTQRVKIVAGVPERYAGEIETGSTVRLRFPAYGGLSMQTAPVSFVGTAIDPDSRTFPIEVRLPNQDRQLKPEMVVNLYLTRQDIEDALVIPRTSVIRDERGESVFIVLEEDSLAIAERRAVDLGPASGDEVVVQDGLEAGDELVISGQSDLSPGEPVEVVEQVGRIE